MDWWSILAGFKGFWASLQNYVFNPGGLVLKIFPFSTGLYFVCFLIIQICMIMRIWSMFHGNQ